MDLLTALLLGLLLGIKHALDVDHVVAVTTIVSRSKSIRRSSMVGVAWGVGHSLTLFAVGFVVLVFKLAVPDRLALSMEFAVGVMLVVLGGPLLWRWIKSRPHVHVHEHEAQRHLHVHSHEGSFSHNHAHLRRSLLVGMVHGMAGSAALTVLALETMSSVIEGLAFLVIFGAGSIAGMLVFSGIIGMPFRFTRSSWSAGQMVQGAAGFLSVIFGILVMWQTAFVNGLF